MHRLLLLTLFVTPVYAEVWEKPPYIPDENHLPSQEVQEEEERKERTLKEKRKQKAGGYRQNMEEETKPNDYTKGTDAKESPHDID